MSHAKLMFAAEVAQMLSTDMQKEGLCGRTLTLKLKTASFEVLRRSILCFFLNIFLIMTQEQFSTLFCHICGYSLIEKVCYMSMGKVLNLRDIMIY